MARTDWYRLDNVGKFYAAEAGRARQTVFRFCATMADEVDPEALQAALDDTIAKFPSFNVCLRSGIFWHYLEPSGERPLVQPETLPVCFGLHTGPKSVLFRVSWYENRINVEVSHMISDGRGTLRFFRTLVGYYAQARYGVPLKADAEDADDAAERQAEDSFSRHYDATQAASTPGERAFRLRGLRDFAQPTYLEYHLPVQPVLDWARSMDVSVTSLIIAAVIVAIRGQMTQRDRERERHIRLNVPVDLRQFFNSPTMRNFFGLASVSYAPGVADESLESIARNVQAQIAANCTSDAVQGRMNRMIGLEKNAALRLAPLFLKDIALELAARITARDVTTTVSSLGRIELPVNAAPFVRSVSVLTSSAGINFVACTFGDDLCLGISTVYRRLDAVRTFCRLFSAHGIDGRIDINHDSQEVDRRLHEAFLEDTLREFAEKRAKEGKR